MDVKIEKELPAKIKVKNNGIEFAVRSPDESQFKGKLNVNKKGLTWYEGKARKDTKKVKEIEWDEFIKYMLSR